MISIEHFKNIVKCGSELTIDGNFYYKVVFIDSTFIEFYHPLNQRYIRILLTAFCSNIKIMEYIFQSEAISQSGAISEISITLIDPCLFQAQLIDIKETPTFPVGAPVLCFFCKGNGFINKLSHVQSCEKCNGSGHEIKTFHKTVETCQHSGATLKNSANKKDEVESLKEELRELKEMHDNLTESYVRHVKETAEKFDNVNFLILHHSSTTYKDLLRRIEAIKK